MSAADTRVQRITERLTATFSPQVCLVEDESALHAGHAGAASGGGHYRIRHRLVYDCLSDLMQQEIHALAIVALSPSEATN
jgi:BolA protein